MCTISVSQDRGTEMTVSYYTGRDTYISFIQDVALLCKCLPMFESANTLHKADIY